MQSCLIDSQSRMKLDPGTRKPFWTPKTRIVCIAYIILKASAFPLYCRHSSRCEMSTVPDTCIENPTDPWDIMIGTSVTWGGLTPVDKEADLRENVLLAVHHKCPQHHQNALKVFFLNKCKEFVYDRYSCLTYFKFTKCFMSVFLKLQIIQDSYHLHFINKKIEAQRRWVLSQAVCL